MRADSPGIKLFDPAKLIRLEARCVSDYVLDGALPPFTRVLRVRTARGELTEPASIKFSLGLKLQEE